MIKLLALLIPLFSYAGKVAVPMNFTRVPFTGERFMYKEGYDDLALFQKLFDEGRVQFLRFVPEKKIKQTDFDFGSKVLLGHDVYLVTFDSQDALRTFAREKLTEESPYDFPYSTISYGLLIGIRDYAIGNKDVELIKILLEKMETRGYAGSANEAKAKIYEPLQKALKRLEKK